MGCVATSHPAKGGVRLSPLDGHVALNGRRLFELQGAREVEVVLTMDVLGASPRDGYGDVIRMTDFSDKT